MVIDCVGQVLFGSAEKAALGIADFQTVYRMGLVLAGFVW